MRILWLCNSLISEIAEEQGLAVFKPESWIKGIYEILKEDTAMEVMYLFPGDSDDISFKKGNVFFQQFIGQKEDYMNDDQILFFERILREYKPDVIHIFGSEVSHSYAMYLASCKENMSTKVVVSIQGLVHIYAKHYFAGLDSKVLNHPSFRDILRFDSIRNQQAFFYRRGLIEQKLLAGVNHVIGRTEWDCCCSKRINPNVMYHFCNETLRESFYSDKKWSIDNCEKHSIFISQSSYPIKGLHCALEIFAEIKKKYPDAHLYTTGDSPYANTMMKKIKQRSYSKYLCKLIEDNGLQDSITFLGYLNEEEMHKQYLKSNVFLSTSSIENSPNSVGEAMILGVPTVSSDVGGVKQQIIHNENGYVYPFDESYMIPYYVSEIFDSDEKMERISMAAIDTAEKIYDRTSNYEKLKSIYEEIV